MFAALKKAATAMMEKDTQFNFVVNNFIMKNSNVNGIVNEKTVNEFYELILGISRCDPTSQMRMLRR